MHRNLPFRLTIVFLLLALGARGAVRAALAEATAGDRGDAPQAVADAFLRCSGGGDAACALKLFHFPPEYTAGELQKDSAGVRSILELFEREFGRPTDPKVVTHTDPFLTLGVGGADAAYWGKHPDFSLTEFKVNFDKEGQGIVAIQACRIGSVWQIRSVRYGLPESRADAKQRIDAVYEKMMALP